MRIQGCTLIYNLAGKSRKYKTSGLERETIALHTQLPPTPAAYVAQLMLSQATSHLCEQAVFPSSFHQEEDTPTLDVFPDTKEKLSTIWLTSSKKQESHTKAQAAEVSKWLQLLQHKKKNSLRINNIFLRAKLAHFHCSLLSLDQTFKGLDQGSPEVWCRAQTWDRSLILGAVP